MATHIEAEPVNVPRFELHHRLARALEWSGVTPAEMAAELGVHVNSVHNYASGRRSPKRAIVAVWALRTGVPIEWLWTGEVPSDPGGGSPNLGPDTGWYRDISRLPGTPLKVAA